jgi:hypothetical protein
MTQEERENALRTVERASVMVALAVNEVLHEVDTSKRVSKKGIRLALTAMRLLGQADVVRLLLTKSPEDVQKDMLKWLKTGEQVMEGLTDL